MTAVTNSMSTTPHGKNTLRSNAKRMRAGAREMLGIKAAEDATKHGMQLLAAVPTSAVIAAYWPIGDELDPRLLMHALENAGYELALPVVTSKDMPLLFRRWGLGDPLSSGPFGTQQPLDDAPIVIPDVIIAPLLAFDADCYRLGYGGGFYDRTIANHTHIKAFGFAYGAQFVDTLPREAHDWPMQGIITETGVVLPRKTMA